MLRMNRTIVGLSVSVALLAGACGGDPTESSSPTTPVAGEPEVTASTSVSTDPVVASPTDAPPTATTPAATAASDDDVPVEAANDIGPGDGLAAALMVPDAPPPVTVTAPATFEEWLLAMFTDLVQTTVDTPTTPDTAMVDFLDTSAGREAPELVVAALGRAAHAYAVIGGIVAAWFDAGAAAGYGPDADVYIAPRRAFATALNEQSLATVAMAHAAFEVDWITQRCIADALLDDLDCEQPIGQEVLADLVAILEASSDLDAPDDADRDLPRDLDLCAIWDTVPVAADDLERFDLVVDDSYLDTRFLGRSECRYQAGLDEDATWDATAGAAALALFYQRVAAAAAYAGFNEDAYDNLTGADYEFAKNLSLILIGQAIVEAAEDVLTSVDEPRLRLGILGAATLALNDAAYRDLWDDYVGDWEALDERFAPCLESFMACDRDEFQLALTHQRSGEGGFSSSDPVIDWDREVADLYDVCAIWAESAAPYDEASTGAADFSVHQLGIDEVIGLDDCPSSGDDSAAVGG